MSQLFYCRERRNKDRQLGEREWRALAFPVRRSRSFCLWRALCLRLGIESLSLLE